MSTRISRHLGIALGVFLVAVVSALWALRSAPPDDSEAEWSLARPGLDAGAIQAVTIRQPDSELHIQREGDGWSHSGPSGMLDFARVHDLTTAMAHLQLGPDLQVDPTDEFGLSPPLFEVILTLGTGEEFRIEIGLPTPDGHHDYTHLGGLVRVSRTPISHIIDSLLESTQTTPEAAP